jgi:hypothetical protein
MVAEAGEGTEGDIFFIGRTARRTLELFARQSDQAAEIALPQLLGGGRVAGPKLADPVGHRPFRWQE